MNFSRTLSAAIGIALLVTVPFKLRDSKAEKLKDFVAVQQVLNQNLERASAALLAHEGFKIAIENRSQFVIGAQQNDCHLQIREVAATGFDIEAITAAVPKEAQLSFVYRGKLWARHPILSATVSENWSRLKWRFDWDSSWSPVLLIAAVGPCTIETIHWDRLATIQAN